MKKFLQRYDYRHTILFLGFMAIMMPIVFSFSLYLNRLFISIYTLVQTVIYYVIAVFTFNRDIPLPPQVFDVIWNQAGGNINTFLPFNFDVLLHKIGSSFVLLVNREYFLISLNKLVQALVLVLPLLNPVLMICLIAYLYFKDYYDVNQLSIDHHSKPLRLYHRFYEKAIIPAINYLLNFLGFFLGHKIWFWLYLVAIALSINIIPVAIDIVSFLLFFSTSFVLSSVYKTLLMILVDLMPFLTRVPWPVYLIVGYAIFDHIRSKKGYERLMHMENYNKGYIKSLGISVFYTGKPGKGKSTIVADNTLSADEMIRDKAFDAMADIVLKFPNFPWFRLEKDIEQRMARGEIVNRFQAAQYIEMTYDKWSSKPVARGFYRYDLKYPFSFYDGLGSYHIVDACKEYVQHYMIYLRPVTVMGNFSIRTDPIFVRSYNHFPIWIYDWFQRDYRHLDFSRMSKPLIWDTFRLGRKVNPEGPYNSSYDGGAVAIAEVAKNLGNQIENKQFKARDEEANPMNDKFAWGMKLIRNFTTVGYTCYAFVAMDDQRSDSLGADARQTCESVVYIDQVDDVEVTLRLWWLEPMICRLIINAWKKRYKRFRAARNDQTLFIRALTKSAHHSNKYMLLKLNTFGYKLYHLKVASDIENSVFDRDQKYFALIKKIWSHRFNSTMFKGIFDEQFKKSKYGFVDIPSFQDLVPSMDEFDLMEDYMFKALKVFAETGSIFKTKTMDSTPKKDESISGTKAASFDEYL